MPPPDVYKRQDLERIKKEVAKLYDATEVILNVTVDDSLLSGYVLQDVYKRQALRSLEEEIRYIAFVILRVS